MDARLRRGEQLAEGEKTIKRLFELVQLDIWASLASALALPSAAIPERDRSSLAAYVKEEQDTYASFAREAVKKKVRDDREYQQGGSDAVKTLCQQIDGAIAQLIAQLLLASNGTNTEELVQLRECKQLSGSVLELYHAAASLKDDFQKVWGRVEMNHTLT